MKRKVLIVTLNDYIIYQPTLLNLYDALQYYYEVTIVSFEPQYISKTKDDARRIVYLKTSYLLTELFQKADFILSRSLKSFKYFFPKFRYHYLYYNIYLPGVLRRELKNFTGDIVIAVDVPALYICQKIYGQVDFLSLEIDKEDPFLKKIKIDKIKSVFIQNEIRYRYLFNGHVLKTFYIQNAPVFKESYITNSERKDFIWAGTILERFGVMDCIEFFENYPQYRLVLKGGAEKKTLIKIKEKYGHLISAGKIEINQDYLSFDDLIRFLSTFRIGFCFYSWELIRENFNYQTAPSGKLFMYLAAGTPVIACNIPGFDFVKEFGAGVLINDYEPPTILEAIKKIEANYQTFSKACYTAAGHFSFDKAVVPYINYLESE